MKKIFIYILCFSVGTTTQTILAQNTASNPTSVLEVPVGVTKDQVIDAYETALGSKEKLASVQSMETYMETENPMVGGILIVMKQMEGHLLHEFLLKADMSPMAKMVITPDDSFMVQQGQQSQLPPEAKKGLQKMLDGGYFSSMAKVRSQGTLVGIEKSETEDLYKITIPSEASDSDDEFYFGVTTGHLLKTISTVDQMGQKIRMETQYSDYKSFDGILFAGITKIGARNGMPEEVMTLKNVKINSGLTAEDFK